MVEKSKSDLPKIGYLYHYPNPDHPTEKFRLDIFISSMPTGQHFDVLRTHFSVRTSQDTIGHLKVTDPWPYERDARVCAGLVIMEDRKGKKEEAFTFGGQLQIDGQELQTVCRLVSPAPILEISEATPVHRLFIEEIQIVLAECQAKYSDHKEYEKRLSKADPLRLYPACLKALIEKFESLQHKDDKDQQLLVYLHSQEYRSAMAGLIEHPMPTLENIFGINGGEQEN